jgi:hypothetical protein
MPAKKATKMPGVYASLYPGDFQLSFDCVGVEVCKFALCALMPPDGSEECTYMERGSCLCHAAKYEAIKALANRLKNEMKDLDE